MVMGAISHPQNALMLDDVIKWKHFTCYWLSVRGIHRSPVNSPHKGRWCGALMFALLCAWINGWVNNREADDLRRFRAHYDVIVMGYIVLTPTIIPSHLCLNTDSNVGWPNVGPTSVLSSWRWPNGSSTNIAEWEVSREGKIEGIEEEKDWNCEIVEFTIV